MLRVRVADEDYIDFAAMRLNQNMKLYSEYLKPDSYYLVETTDEYKFFKYVNGEILIRDYDKYISQ